MTTTELIELLKGLEYGGATGEPRKISISVTDKEGCYYPVLDSRSRLIVDGTGDGIAGATLELSIKPMPRAESLPHDDYQLESMNEALVSTNNHLREKVKELELKSSTDRFIIHKMMDAISLQCGRSQEDKQAMLRLLSRVLEVAEHENISEVDIIDQLRSQLEDLS